MALELKHLTKRVGAETHIHETDLVLAEKGFNILLGTTLSGKTTLMQLMAGIDKPTSGEIWFKGANVTGVPVQKRNVAMVYQQFINYPNFTVYENIASPLRIAKVPKRELGDRVAQVATLMRLDSDAQAHAERALRRPAAAGGDRPRPGQGCRARPARRAARQSRLQAARGATRRAAEALRGPRLHGRLRDHGARRSPAPWRPYRSVARGPDRAIRADFG